jgi:hypothetical protein
MGNPFDQLAKKIGLRALAPSGFTAVEHEIPSNAHQVDLRHDPDPARGAERARLGLLGRLASIGCLMEVFSRAPGEERVIDCVGKLLAFRQERRREADKAEPEVPFVKPFLWIISAGRPSGVLSLLGAVPAEGWPRGVYLSPGKPVDAAPREPGGMLRVGIVVASELRRERSTILVRIMAGGTVLPAALADLAALPPDAYEREVASMDVLELRRALGSKPERTVEEEEYVVSTRDAFEEVKEEGRTEEAARAVLIALRVRGVAVGDAARERILAQKDRSLLERWHERAVVAASIGEVFGDPS